MNAEITTTLERYLVITRVFDAPRELVWKAWTEPGLCIPQPDRKKEQPCRYFAKLPNSVIRS